MSQSHLDQSESRESGLEQATAALRRLGEVNGEFCRFINEYLAAKPSDTEKWSDQERQMRMQLLADLMAKTYQDPKTGAYNTPGPGIQEGDCNVVFGTHENLEGSLYISEAGDKVRYRWGGSPHQHIYLNETNFAFGDQAKQARVARIEGDDVVGMNEQGVQTLSLEARRASNEQMHLYRRQMADRAGVRKSIARAVKGVLGTKDVVPQQPEDPTPVTISHQALADVADRMAGVLRSGLKILEGRTGGKTGAETPSESAD